MDNLRKNTFTGSHTIKIMMVCIVMLMAINLVSAFEFDNVKQYDTDTKTITIKNSVLGIPFLDLDTVSTIKLDTPLINSVGVGYVRVAEFTINQEDTSYTNALKEIKFYDVKDGLKEVPIVFDYKYKNIRIENGTNRVCSPTNITNITKEDTKILNPLNETCEDIPYEREIEEWLDYTGKDMLKGEITIGIYTTTTQGQKVEWIPSFYGIEIKEWAVWDADLNVGLVNYYNFDETSGTTAIDGVGNNNITLSSDIYNSSGKLGSKLTFDGTNTGTQVNNIDSAVTGAGARTLNFWGSYRDIDGDTDFLLGYGGLANQRLYNWGRTGSTHYLEYYASSEVFGTIPIGTMDMYTLVYTGTHTIVYKNGIGAVNQARALNTIQSQLNIGMNGQGIQNCNGCSIDELGIWNRTLTPTEITQSYNGGTGITYTDSFNDAPNVTLNLPINYFNTTSSNVLFNYSCSDDTQVENVTFYINGVLNKTTTNGASNFTSVQETLGFSDGNYNWSVNCFDSEPEQTNSSVQYFSVDTTAPDITIHNPISSDYFIAGSNETLNWTVVDTNFESVWWEYNGTNTTLIGAINSTTFPIEIGIYNGTLWANDSVGNINSEFIEWNYSIFETGESHSDPVLEGSSQTFYINVTSNQSLTAYLIYDGSSYLGSCTQNSSDFNCLRVLSIPPVSAEINVTFYWAFLMADLEVYNRTSENLTVHALGMDNCSVNTIEIMNFTLKDEATNTLLEGNTSEIEIETNIYFSNDILIANYSGVWTNNSNGRICVSNLTDVNYDLYTTGEFSIDDYVHEFYFIDKKQINTTTVPIYINFMDLANVDSTSFLFNYFNEDGLSVSNPVIHTWRKYIGEGLFREVERSKQNDDGDTIVHLVEEDVIYYFQVSQNDTIIFTSDTYTALCDTAPCTITLEASKGYQDFEGGDDWDLIDGGAYAVSSNAITRTVNLTFATATPSTFNLTVYKLDSTGEYDVVGSDQTTGTSGTVEVVVPASSGNVSFFSTVTQNDEYKSSYWADFSATSREYFGSGFAIFLGLLIILSLGLMAISEGSGTIVFVILGMFLTVILGLIDYGSSGIGIGLMIYFILTGGIIIWKLTRRNR